jgi:hypothetical protein
MKRIGSLLILFVILTGFSSNHKAQPKNDWLPPLKESFAYKQFALRPYSDLSKLVYLIDRFMEADIQILYDGHYYSAKFAKQVARWFLISHYKKEKPEKWVMQWCNKTMSGNLIWVKFSDGTLQPSREILINELKVIEKVYIENQVAQKSAELPLPPIPAESLQVAQPKN